MSATHHYAIHPYCDLFPPPSEEERASLKKSMVVDKQQFPIILYQGKVLDGKTRLEICLEIGVKPWFEQYKGDDPLGFVFASNFARRHLTTMQRASIALKLLPMLEESAAKRMTANLKKGQQIPDPAKLQERDKGEKTEIAGAMAGVSSRTVADLKSVAETSPQLADKVVAGDVSLSEAKAELKKGQTKNEDVLDSTGYKVPEELVWIWQRRNEVLEIMKMIATAENRLKEYQKTNDPIFSTVNYSDTISHLQYAHGDIRNNQLYAVCPSCQGRGRKTCTHCKGRGFISSQQWEFVPGNIKKVRGASCKS